MSTRVLQGRPTSNKGFEKLDASAPGVYQRWMHQQLGFFKVDALADGMVAPSLPLSYSHEEDGHPLSSDKPILASPSSLKAGNAHYNPDATYIIASATIDINAEGGRHGNKHPEEGITGFIKGEHDINMVEESKTEMEGFIMGDHDIGTIQDPISEIDGVVKGVHDNGKVQQPPISRDRVANVNTNVGCTPRKRRVQWNDSYGKELVHVLEFEQSDTGESEDDDDDDADSHACTCTIQ